ncbi:MAG TPA: translation initiation factor [Lacibacter sp.]|nr:translation initiation factor [Lacibacter sp.]
MNKKNKADSHGFVYSTDPDFKYEFEDTEPAITAAPSDQKLIVKLETKHRAGKMVTLVDGFTGTDEDAEKLGKQLRNYCGTGGSYKDGEIIVQGDQREKVLQFLLKNGYSKAKKQ